jgi:hypothetical protein
LTRGDQPQIAIDAGNFRNDACVYDNAELVRLIRECPGRHPELGDRPRLTRATTEASWEFSVTRIKLAQVLVVGSDRREFVGMVIQTSARRIRAGNSATDAE